MKTYLDCLPCFIRQAWDALNLVTEDETVQEKVLRRVLDFAAKMDFRDPPPVMGAQIHRIIRQETGDPDPYSTVKNELTDFVLSLLPELRARIEASDDPFDTALRLAVAGNIIDFSVSKSISRDSILSALEETLVKPFALDSRAILRKQLRDAKSVMILGDNAGEIVMDRLLIEQIGPERVTFVVRGAPVINDAAFQDARRSGLTGFVTVIDNGTDIPGTWLRACPEPFLERFMAADVVISKGQGNFESLTPAPRDVFFLMRAKCGTICKELECRLGDVIAHRLEGNSGAE